MLLYSCCTNSRLKQPCCIDIMGRQVSCNRHLQEAATVRDLQQGAGVVVLLLFLLLLLPLPLLQCCRSHLVHTRAMQSKYAGV
jgi:hypothetical protein